MPSKLKKLVSRAKKVVKRGLKNKQIRTMGNQALSALGIDAEQRRAIAGTARAATAIFGNKKLSTTKSMSVPASKSVYRANQTYSEVVGKITSDYAGSSAQGIRIRGCQPFVVVVNPTGAGKVFKDDVANVALDGLDTIVLISPLTLQGPLLTQASNYTMYAFRRFRLEYTSVVGSIYTGEFAMCYVREPTPAVLASGAVPTSFAEAREVVPSVSIPYRGERVAFEWTYDGQQLFYLHDTDPTQESDDRLSIQGQMRAYSDNISDGTPTGYLTLHYELDLFYPTINTFGAFAASQLHGLGASELLEIKRHIREIRERKERPVARRLGLQLYGRTEEPPADDGELVPQMQPRTLPVPRSVTPAPRK